MQLEIQVKVFVRLNFMSRSPTASRPPFVATPNYIPQGYMSGNSKTRESRLNGPVVVREDRKRDKKIHGILLDFNGIFRREDRVFGT